MNDDLDDQLDAPGAIGIEAHAADWLARKQFWTWSVEDQTQLDAWLAESPAHEIAYWRLQGALARTERLAALRPGRTPRWRGSFLARIAAAVVLVTALVGGYWVYTSRPEGLAYATSVGGHETIVLSDGSRIELNTDTAIRVGEDASGRKIWLEKGEAYFQVLHDASHPLTVYADDRRITDLGTKFTVRRDSDRLEVAVMEGSVNFTAPQDAHALFLTAGETMVATSTSISVMRKSDHDLANELGWRRGMLVFNGTPLAEAVREINRYNRRKIVIADPKLENISLTATLSANEPEQFIRMTKYLLAQRGQKAGGKILISR